MKAFERGIEKRKKTTSLEKEANFFRANGLEKPIPIAKKTEKEVATFKEVHSKEEEGRESMPREVKTNRRYTRVSEMINPLRPQDWKGINSKFGKRVHPILKTIKHHSGIDIPAPTGVPVYAVLDGVVVASSYDSASGNYVKIDHGNGLMSSYAHLSRIEARKHQEIRRGQIVGRVGATGRVTGPHLHYTVFLNGKRVNPEKYLLWK